MTAILQYALLLGVLLAPSVYSADAECKDDGGPKTITISPSFISMLGNKPIKVEGQFLQGAILVQFKFKDTIQTTVNAGVVNNVATCIAPFFYTNGRIQVDLLVTRADTTVETFTGFIYTVQHKSEIKFQLVSQTGFTISWEQTSFESGVTLDLELLELSGGIWTSRGVVQEGLLNTGSFSGEFDRVALDVLLKLKNVYVLKLKPSCPHCRVQQPPTNDCTNILKCNSLISDLLLALRGKTEAELNDLCYSWYVQDNGAPTDVLDCPQTVKEAEADTNFEPVDDLDLYNPGADKGFQQRVPSPSGAGQRCVYKNGNLLCGPRSGGNVRSVSPNGKGGMTAHFVADLLPWYTCCALIKNQAACDLYYERRPSCKNHTHHHDHHHHHHHHGGCHGDPHITTFDGHYYTFNGVGEFWLTKIQDKSFMMQARTGPYILPSGQKTKAAVVTAVAMQQKNCGDPVTVQLSIHEKKIKLLLDGYEVPYDTRPNRPKLTIVHNGVSIAINSFKYMTIAFSSGYSFSFTLGHVDLSVINMEVTVISHLEGKIDALLGTVDDDRSNDYTLPNGSVYPINSSPQKIHEYGMKWGITAEESLFKYPPCKNFSSYDDKDFVPTFVPNLDNLPPKAVAACRGNQQCLFDLAVTGDSALATSTLEAAERLEALVAIDARPACQMPTKPSNGFIQVTNLLQGSSVKLVCNEKYVVNGTATITCVSGFLGSLSWDGSLGTCALEDKCAGIENEWEKFLCEQDLLNKK